MAGWDNAPLGLANDVVELRAHDDRWTDLFLVEAAQLRSMLGRAILAVEHIGSTAIPAMPAKPLLDMMAAVADDTPVRDLVSGLAVLGYEDCGPAGVPERTLFAKGPPERRTHHLSLVPAGADYWRDQILFRDYLRAHGEAAAAYAALKQDLLRRYRTARPDYTGGKTAFVGEVLARARAITGRPARPSAAEP